MDTQQKHQPGTEVQGGTRSAAMAWATLDSLTSRLCVVDAHQNVVASNRAWREFPPASSCPCAPATSGCGELWKPWRMPCWSAATTALVGQAIEDLRSGKQEGFSLEYECPNCTPSRWFLMRIKCLPGDGCSSLVIQHDDISERKLAEQAQHLSALRLKQLGAHLESIREEQSAAIARELHDELGAKLTMLKLDLATTSQQFAQTLALRRKFASLLEQVNEALQMIKRISSSLRPATLDTLGLMATIRWYVERFSHTTGISIQLQLPDYVRLSKISSIAVFRIFQEGLTNVAAHSGASKVSILVEKNNGDLLLEISDNGQGISTEQLQNSESFGIIGMRERAHYLGGHFSIDNIDNGGTRLRLRIPLDSESPG